MVAELGEWLDEIDALAREVDKLSLSHPECALAHQSLKAAEFWLKCLIDRGKESA